MQNGVCGYMGERQKVGDNERVWSKGIYGEMNDEDLFCANVVCFGDGF
jgi:hypothetical protein